MPVRFSYRLWRTTEAQSVSGPPRTKGPGGLRPVAPPLPGNSSSGSVRSSARVHLDAMALADSSRPRGTPLPAGTQSTRRRPRELSAKEAGFEQRPCHCLQGDLRRPFQDYVAGDTRGLPGLPGQVVMRRDAGLNLTGGTSVATEFPLLRCLHDHGVPVPEVSCSRATPRSWVARSCCWSVWADARGVSITRRPR